MAISLLSKCPSWGRKGTSTQDLAINGSLGLAQVHYEQSVVSLCRRLRTLFLQKPTSATAVETSSGEKRIQNLANQFKKKSNFRPFRGQRLVYKTTVRRLAKGGHFSYIHEILDHQKVYPDIKDEHFTARLICLYGKAKMLDHALQLFDEMPELNCPRTVLSLNALMAACFPPKASIKLLSCSKNYLVNYQ
ncbi:UNVERIFIED_CONTAM: Pentatricopeptide repeat-containing protein, mitochondrial [Sesamum angustifolium]|uniref:Pentatricopeptide repeat-containing protein, mitochondrial n=1 Tax=Sesamum angustifolium TaxID=2727405 RepID=A0AAW2LKE4_9LAMI